MPDLPPFRDLRHNTGTVHKRFTRWPRRASEEGFFDSLTSDPVNQYLMLDTALVRVHRQAVNGKGGPKIGLWGVSEAD
jgi:hypothetical protein